MTDHGFAYAGTLCLLLLGVTLLTGGCKETKGRCALSGVQAEVSGSHGHRVLIPGEDVDRGGGGTYRVEGGEHEHGVVLTAADFEKFERGETVVKRATSVNAHTHEITLQCPEPSK